MPATELVTLLSRWRDWSMKSLGKIHAQVLKRDRITCAWFLVFSQTTRGTWLTTSDVDIYVVSLNLGDMNPTQKNMHLRK